MDLENRTMGKKGNGAKATNGDLRGQLCRYVATLDELAPDLHNPSARQRYEEALWDAYQIIEQANEKPAFPLRTYTSLLEQHRRHLIDYDIKSYQPPAAEDITITS